MMVPKEDSDQNIRRYQTKDGRGRPVKLLDPVMLQVWHRHDVIEADALDDIVEELEPGTAKMRRRLIVIVPASIVLLTLGMVVLYFVSDASARKDLISTLTNPAIMVPSVICCTIIPWMTARQARMNRIQFAMLKHRRCPHCGYNLRGLPAVPPDGTTVCPECGCVWLIDDVVLANRLAEASPTALVPKHQKKVIVVVLALLILSALLGVVMFLRFS